ncbi:MAG TPA: glycerophosphodiester phosphodiesterase [Sedimentisphaerales bacterium]|nr:glycerophosphodiester phosphodiesterase [Sedimentisphaerales bacterium]HRV49836.1 glycerophosphodiester phosphodiesterase [Sedimentisphaerales bacterium]
MRKKHVKMLLGSIALLIALWIVLSFRARPIPDHPFFGDDRLLVIAHRGGAGLWPENTLYAFEHAVELGVDVLEMDVQSTKDGELVVIHDETVDRTTNGTGRVEELTLAEIQDLDAGHTWTPDDGASYPFRGQGLRIPALVEVLAAFPKARMNIEIKQRAIVATLCRMLRDYGMAEQVLIAAFDAQTMNEFRRLCPEVATAAAENEIRMFYGLNWAHLGRFYRPPAEALQIPEYHGDRHVLTQSFVRAAHGRNMDVHVWVVNDINDMQRMEDLGIDGIITDYPDRLKAVLGRPKSPR